MESEPLENIMGAQVGKIFRAILEKSGVHFHMSASVASGKPSASDSAKIGKVVLKDGTELDADLVIEGVGVKPATQYLFENKSVQLNDKDKSIMVDASYAMKGVSDAFAIGDIATYPYHGPGGNGAPIRIEHWDVAQKHAGRSVASHHAMQPLQQLQGSQSRFIPVFWSAVGSQLRYCGTHATSGYDDVIVQGNTDVSEGKQSWVAYYTQGRRGAWRSRV